MCPLPSDLAPGAFSVRHESAVREALVVADEPALGSILRAAPNVLLVVPADSPTTLALHATADGRVEVIADDDPHPLVSAMFDVAVRSLRLVLLSARANAEFAPLGPTIEEEPG